MRLPFPRNEKRLRRRLNLWNWPEQIHELAVSRAFRIAGEVDALIIVERENLDEILKKLYSIDGIEDTRSYVTIEVIK